MTGSDTPFSPVPKLLTVIMDRDEIHKLEDILAEKHVHLHFTFSAMGTASSEILKAFGLSGTEKTVCICMETAAKVIPLMTAVVERLAFVRPGHGIAFLLPVSGICAAISHLFSSEAERNKERWAPQMEAETGKLVPEMRYGLVLTVVNKGFSENVMEAAREVGARGGTIVQARRSDVEEATKFFGISLQAEKEIVAIVARHDQKTALMQAINKTCGIRTQAHGVVLSLPVESCAGIDMGEAEQEL